MSWKKRTHGTPAQIGQPFMTLPDKGVLPDASGLTIISPPREVVKPKKNILVAFKEAITGEPIYTPEEKKIQENIRKVCSRNPIERLEGRTWLIQNEHIDILDSVTKEIEFMRDER